MEILTLFVVSIFIVGIATISSDVDFEPLFFAGEVVVVSGAIAGLCMLA